MATIASKEAAHMFFYKKKNVNLTIVAMFAPLKYYFKANGPKHLFSLQLKADNPRKKLKPYKKLDIRRIKLRNTQVCC